MKKSDFQLIGIIGTVLGVLFLAGGVFATVYFETTWIFVEYPYAKYAPSLLIAGIILLVVGVAFLWRASQEAFPKPSPSQPLQSS